MWLLIQLGLHLSHSADSYQLLAVSYHMSSISCQLSAISCQLVSVPLVKQLSAAQGWLNWAGAIGLADTVTLYTGNCTILAVTALHTAQCTKPIPYSVQAGAKRVQILATGENKKSGATYLEP